MTKNLPKIAFGLVIGIALIFLFIQYVSPLLMPAPQTKPEPIKPKPYEYYILIDDETGETLTYISSVQVTTGDEYISENNKRYVVTKVEENRAYLRSFGPTDAGGEKQQFKNKTE